MGLLEALNAKQEEKSKAGLYGTERENVQPQHFTSRTQRGTSVKRDGTYCGVPLRVADDIADRVRNLVAAKRNFEKESRDGLRGEVLAALKVQQDVPPNLRQEEFIEAILDDLTEYGPLTPFWYDDNISEIMVNTPFQIFAERVDGRMINVTEEYGVTFRSQTHCNAITQSFLHRENKSMDRAVPFADLRVGDNRLHCQLDELSSRRLGALVIRKKRLDLPTIDTLLERKTIDEQGVRLIRRFFEAHAGGVAAGGTGAGKTATQNALLNDLAGQGYRIITIEDTPELTLPESANWMSMITRVGGFDGRGEVTGHQQVRNALRCRPDVLVYGEVRGGEAFDMIIAMNTGHPLSLTTAHANSAEDTIRRVETMIQMGMPNISLHTVRSLIASTIRWVVYQSRLKDGRRKITRIIVLNPKLSADGFIEWRTAYKYDSHRDSWKVMPFPDGWLYPDQADDEEADGGLV